MGKKLSEMTIEELWELFPIFLTEHQDCWAEWYEEEAGILRGILPSGHELHHVGSTAIKGIWAKPIVDILIEVPDMGALNTAGEALKAAGYICMSRGENRADFNKGYTPDGFAERVFHLHLRLIGDHDELYFRDYLNAHPDIAKEYEHLKLGLWREYEHDRDGYTRQKGDFVAEHTARAKKEFLGRYISSETLIRETLPADTQESVLKLLAYLRAEGTAFERCGGYWAGQYYWRISYLNEPVFYLLINGAGAEARFAPLTVWTDDSGSPWFEDVPLDDREKELCREHVDICEGCGSCHGGTDRMICGREFEDVCRTAMRFVNPGPQELELLERLAGLRLADIGQNKI